MQEEVTARPTDRGSVRSLPSDADPALWQGARWWPDSEPSSNHGPKNGPGPTPRVNALSRIASGFASASAETRDDP